MVDTQGTPQTIFRTLALSLSLSFALPLAAVAAPPLAAASVEGKVVGTASLPVGGPAGARRFVSEIWFEAAPGTKAESFAVRAPIRAIDIAREAQPSTTQAKRPLIVMSHGNWGSRYSQGWLALRLVDAGYVVLSTSHPGTLGDDQSPAGRLRLWDRSRDVSAALTELLANPKWSALVDPERIGFAGHSFGGWAAVSLAGGKFDPAVQRAWCKAAARKDPYCESTLQDAVGGISTADASVSYKDARFKAFYIMATGPAQGFSASSLQAITAPFAVDTAQADEILEASANSSALARLIPTATEVLRPVGHFAYVPECKWLVGPLLARAAGTPLCNDPSGVDRRQVHRDVAKDVIAFFSSRLSRR
ncbi:MAG: dienelactone hydrolase family protein [Ramlibacter sp.]